MKRWPYLIKPSNVAEINKKPIRLRGVECYAI
jgi:hypothetical protein